MACQSRAHDVDMTTRWIVGLDGSPSASAALAWAVAFAGERGERVEPLAAWHLPLTIAALSGRRAIDVDRMGIQAEAEYLARTAIADVATSGVAERSGDVIDELLVIEGQPASVLRDQATPDTAVVVGRRGTGTLQHRVVGSVSSYLATHAPGPLVIVPEEWVAAPIERIVVGFDGSEHAAAALEWALAIAPSDAVVEALIAIDVIPWLRPELVVERHPAEVEAARARIGAAVDAVDPDQRARRTFVIHGPREALASAMVDADLVVVGPRGIGGLARIVLGSVTTWLLHEAPCPVAIVPTPPE